MSRIPSLIRFALAWSTLVWAPLASAETVRAPGTADIWLSHATPRESETGAGGSVVFKLKSVQELAAVRFDLERVVGRELRSARLYLRSRSETAPRRLRVSTVTSRWTEGTSARAYSGRDGATWKLADAPMEKPWAWPDSEFSDVCMGAGGSLVETVELRDEGDGWVSAPIDPDLVRAMLCGAADGLALMDAGSPHDRNHYIHSVQSWESGPWLELELGDVDAEQAPPPLFRVEPAPEHTTLTRSAVWVEVRADSTDWAFRGWLNGEALDPWRLPRVDRRGTIRFVLDGLPPRQEQQLELSALTRSGRASSRTAVAFIAPPAQSPAPDLIGDDPAPPALRRDAAPTLWALPPLGRIDPRTGSEREPDPAALDEPAWNLNPVWDGTRTSLRGARGETLAFHLLVGLSACGAESPLRLRPAPLRAVGSAPLAPDRWTLREVWYAELGASWSGAYLRPVPREHWIVPALGTGLPPDAEWRSFLMELRVPPDARPGTYRGEIVVEFECGLARLLPVEVTVDELTLPAQPGFRIEYNAYRVPEDAVAHFRLAREHRGVFTPWVVEPRLVGEAPAAEVEWTEYDEMLGGLLDGSAFGEEDARPLEVLYLPFWESWPLPLTPDTYEYPGTWPERGDPYEVMWDHHDIAASLESAFSTRYLETLDSIQQQFAEHFEARGWNATECHAFYGSKMRHFTRYGRASFWNTDEPLYLADWEALRFFCERFDASVAEASGRWLARADVSRPEWLEGALGGAARIVYSGGFRSEGEARRMRELAARQGFRWMVYGRASTEEQQPLLSGVWALEAYLDGARGALIWLALGDEDSWREMDPLEFPGTALMARLPASVQPAGDLRMLALREAQQLTEWLEAVASREGLSREQIEALVAPSFSTTSEVWWRGRGDEEALIRNGSIHPYEWERLRRRLAERWSSGPR